MAEIMKSWMRITSVVLLLVGGTAFFGYHSLSQFNDALDNVAASYIAIANTPSIHVDKTHGEDGATTTPESIAAATSTDLRVMFAYPKKNDDLYGGCTYQISLQSSSTIQSLESVLVDAGTREAVGPIASGLAKENKIELKTQELAWKVGSVWPGEYVISIAKINDIELKAESAVFEIHAMPEGLKASERGKMCKESGGVL